LFYCIGIETRFGLAFPKYKTTTSDEHSSTIPPLTTLLGVNPKPHTTN
jgi:hypothetical protein